MDHEEARRKHVAGVSQFDFRAAHRPTDLFLDFVLTTTENPRIRLLNQTLI